MSQANAQTAESCFQALSSEAIFVISSPFDEVKLPRMVQRMVALFDGERTLGSVCKEAQISVSKGLTVVRKLSEMNIISATEMSANDAPRPGAEFNSLDEDFFSSDVTLSYDEEEEWRVEQERQVTTRQKLGRLFSSFSKPRK